ncbi:MAG TPA: AgmX/PglI C-terminal domain-containing protein [Polyangiaceae bacterium]|nr:AgmX/PglI C-terminal domain-containing protein [Polyangiaceae bacterium]
MITRSSLFVVLGAWLCVSCGGSEPPPETPDHAAHAPRQHRRGNGAVGVASEIGGMNEERVDATFKRSLDALQECLNKGSERVEYLGGSVAFFVRVNSEGKAEHVHLERSTLGDRQTEKCMLSTLRARRWPKPVGGMNGLARKSFEFDPPSDVRPPIDWDPENVKKGLDKISDKLTECKEGDSGKFEATMYVSAEGSVLAASVTPPDEAGESSVDCLVDALRSASYPSPGSWVAKVSFSL